MKTPSSNESVLNFDVSNGTMGHNATTSTTIEDVVASSPPYCPLADGDIPFDDPNETCHNRWGIGNAKASSGAKAMTMKALLTTYPQMGIVGGHQRTGGRRNCPGHRLLRRCRRKLPLHRRTHAENHEDAGKTSERASECGRDKGA